MNIFTGADKGLSPAWCQAITWASYELLSIKSLSTNFMQWKLIQNTDIFFPENVFKMLFAIYLPFCSGLNVLMV